MGEATGPKASLSSRQSTADAGSSAELHPLMEADAMHALLVTRADALMGATDESDGATELQEITDAVKAYEMKRRPRGKVPGGKG